MMRAPQICLVLVATLMIGVFPVSAEIFDNPDHYLELEYPEEPTPVEEIAPGGEGEVIPGTEPLYDKGITITEIEIIGNEHIDDRLVLEALETRPGSLYSKSRLHKDLQKIYGLGYFTDNIRVIPIATSQGVHLRYEVEENPIVKGFFFEGNELIPDEELHAVFKDQANHPQNINAINAGIQSIEKIYHDQGYVLARVDDINEADDGTVTFKINEGDITKISYVGNTKTKDFVIRRAMAQREGEAYNEEVVAQDMKRLFSTQAFGDVRRVVKASTEKEGAYELTIEVDEKKTGAISVGGGVDTAIGLFGSVGYSNPNFIGRGHNVNTSASLGSGVIGDDDDTVDRLVTQFQASWFNPSINETSNSAGVTVSARELGGFNVPLSIERRVGGEVNWGRPLETVPGMSVGLGLGFEDVNLREGAAQSRLDRLGISAADRAAQLEDGAYAYVSPTVAFDSRNNRFNPTEGWLSNFGSRLAYGADTPSYGTLFANVRRYVPVTDTLTFAVNGQAGGAMVGDIPDFNFFRLGGARNIRGFQEGGVGTGEQYLLGSAELRARLPFLKRFDRLPLYDMLQGATFIDAGRVFNESSSNVAFNRPGYGISVGAGIRVNIPALGPLRIDYAKALGATGDNTRNFNFGVGNKF